MRKISQSGHISVLPLLLVIGAVGLISFLLLASSAPFQNGFFADIFKKPESRAASDPVITQYYIDQSPSGNIVMSKNAGSTYAIQALLKDMQGNVITNQQDFSYSWSIDTFGSPIATISPFSVCTFGIISPCPNDHATVTTMANTGTSATNIKVAVFTNSTQIKVAEALFSLNLVDDPVFQIHVLSPNGGESYKVGQNINLTWNNGTTPVDYYNIYYQYYKNGTPQSGYIGTPPWGSSSFNWIIPGELQNQQFKVEIQASRAGIIVGRDNSDGYVSATSPGMSLSNQVVQNPSNLAIQYNWSPPSSSQIASLMIWNGQTCKSLAGGYAAGDLATSIAIGSSTQYLFSNSQVLSGKSYCAQIWSDFNGGVSSSNPSVVIIGLQGDIDGDGHVTIFDYNILVGNFGKVGSGIPGDIDNNGSVNLFDYNIIVTNFGR